MRSAQLPGGSLGRPLRTDRRRWVCKDGRWLTVRQMVLRASESAEGGTGHCVVFRKESGLRGSGRVGGRT